jgi:hypothetical protein
MTRSYIVNDFWQIEMTDLAQVARRANVPELLTESGSETNYVVLWDLFRFL